MAQNREEGPDLFKSILDEQLTVLVSGRFHSVAVGNHGCKQSLLTLAFLSVRRDTISGVGMCRFVLLRGRKVAFLQRDIREIDSHFCVLRHDRCKPHFLT